MNGKAAVAVFMVMGAVSEFIGVAMIGWEIRKTRIASEDLGRELQEIVANPPALPLGNLVIGIVRFLDKITLGSRVVRIMGLGLLLYGIALTLWANLWALFLVP